MANQQNDIKDPSTIFSSIARLQKAMDRLSSALDKYSFIQKQKKDRLAQELKKLITDYKDTLASLSIEELEERHNGK